jgi:hypothetical protein
MSEDRRALILNASNEMSTQILESTVNRTKWLAILSEWVPTERLEVLVALINLLIEAAGPSRVERLDELITHINETTRSGREKFQRLRRWGERMRDEPPYWPQRFVRARTVSILIKRILDQSSRPLNTSEIEQKYRKFREVPPSGLSQELREMARRGEIDRIAAGLYWRKGTAVKPYESQTQQVYRLVHDAPGRRMRNADLAVAMNISRQDLETLLAQMRKRWRNPPLIKGASGGMTAVSPKSLAVLKRDGRIVDGRGSTFFKTPNFVERTGDVTFATLAPKRPPVDSGTISPESDPPEAPQERVRSAEVLEADRHVEPLQSLIDGRSPPVPANNEIRSATMRRHSKSSPTLERARRAIEDLYPAGLPDQGLEPNANLCRRVGDKLRQLGLPDVSDDTILRAADRRRR